MLCLPASFLHTEFIHYHTSPQACSVAINSLVSRLKTLRSKRLSHLTPVIDDVLIEARQRKQQIDDSGKTTTQRLFLHYLAPWEYIKLMRAGDARESCLNTGTAAPERLAALMLDRASVIFILTDDQDRGVGHIHTKLEIQDTGKLICDDEGLYLFGGSPGPNGTRAIVAAMGQALKNIGVDWHAISVMRDYDQDGLSDYSTGDMTVTRLTSLGGRHSSYSESRVGSNETKRVSRTYKRLV